MKSLKAANEDSILLIMPDIGDAHYLVPLLFEAGTVEQNGMGISPLSWQEIDSWLSTTGLNVTTWELLTLKQMSEAYAAEFSQANKPDRPAPYSHIVAPDEIDREAVAKKIKGVFSALKRNSSNKIE